MKEFKNEIYLPRRCINGTVEREKELCIHQDKSIFCLIIISKGTMLTSDTCYDSPAHNGMLIKVRKTTTADHISLLIAIGYSIKKQNKTLQSNAV